LGSQEIISRVLFCSAVAHGAAAIIPLGRPLPGRLISSQPWDSGGRPFHAFRRIVPLCGLAPGGVCRAAGVTVSAVGSYPTVSPLRAPKRPRSVFCCTVLEVTLTGRYPAPCPVELGLSSRLSAGDHLFFCDRGIVVPGARPRKRGRRTWGVLLSTWARWGRFPQPIVRCRPQERPRRRIQRSAG
jgi:hypothetical protein